MIFLSSVCLFFCLFVSPSLPSLSSCVCLCLCLSQSRSLTRSLWLCQFVYVFKCLCLCLSPFYYVFFSLILIGKKYIIMITWKKYWTLNYFNIKTSYTLTGYISASGTCASVILSNKICTFNIYPVHICLWHFLLWW